MPIEYEFTISEMSETYNMDLNEPEIDFALAEAITLANGDAYEGDYEVTPSGSMQVLPSANRYLEQNITINPIPNNYGLITWNGSTLTVS